ncbi:MAG: hypothetical protein ACLQVL_20630 [Terriglobia bacterium]
MRKIGAISIIAFIGILALIPRDRSTPIQASAPLPDKTLSFRIVFGERQERLADYSGSVTLDAGKVVTVMPWRLFKEDAVNSDGSWKVHIKHIQFENQPDSPRPLDTAERVVNFVPAGVTVTVEAPPTARAKVRTAQGDFRFGLQELEYGRALSFRDGDVAVQRTPTPQQISPIPQGANPEEHDYPSMCVTRKGVVWVAWQAYQDLGDQVYVRYSTASGWSEPVRMTDEKGDVFHTAVGEDSVGKIWVVWSERTGED